MVPSLACPRPSRTPFRAVLAALLAILMAVPIALAWPGGASASGPSVWLSASEIAALPMSGSAWNDVLSTANVNLVGMDANLAHRTKHNIVTLAAALVAARRNDNTYRAKVRTAIAAVMAVPPDTTDVLAACRRLGTYAVAADLIGLSAYDPAFDATFRSWLASMLKVSYTGGSGGGTIVAIHERRANNFGTDAGASRLAVALYLGDTAQVARVATVFKGWLGDRSSYAGFDFSGDLSWQSSASSPVGINPKGAVIAGHNVDGVLPEDQRRASSFTWPPPKENYVWGALQGATFQAQMLSRQGYDVWHWQDSAMLRAITWLHVQDSYPALTDDVWIIWVINRAYGTSFPTGRTLNGKGMTFTSWTHAGRAPTAPAPPASAQPAPVLPPPTAQPAPVPTPPTAPAATVRYLGTVTGQSRGLAAVTSATVTPGAGSAYLASVSTRASRGVTRVRGLGLRWVKAVEQCSGRGTSGVSLWVGTGTATAAGPVSATLRSAAKDASIAVAQFTGLDPVAPVVSASSANTLGPAGACRGGVDSAAYSVATTGGAGDLVVGAVSTRGSADTPGPGFTERLDLARHPAGQATQDVVTTAARTPVRGRLAARVDWAVAALRLRAAR